MTARERLQGDGQVSESAMRAAAAGLNHFVTLLEAYLEVVDGSELEVMRRLRQAAADLVTLQVVSSVQADVLLAKANRARGAGPLAARGLWDAVAVVRDALVERYAPPPSPWSPQW